MHIFVEGRDWLHVRVPAPFLVLLLHPLSSESAGEGRIDSEALAESTVHGPDLFTLHPAWGVAELLLPFEVGTPEVRD